MHLSSITSRWRWPVAAALLAALVLLGDTRSSAQFKGFFKNGPEAKPAPASARLTHDAWSKVPMQPISSAEIDQLIQQGLSQSKIKTAPLTTDEQFIRRASIDLTGRLPSADTVTAFVADTAPDKRARLIDQLLASEQFGKHWAGYWKDVIAARVIDRQGLIAARGFELWLAEQFNKNSPWDQIVRSILTAEGQVKFQSPTENGPVFLMMSRRGPEAANDRAAETARIFLGIQIQCAQCHDHPFDQWKQVQFHELAGYFARLRERFIFENQKIVGFELVSTPFGEQQMPDKGDQRKTLTAHPRFLDGKAPPRNLPDKGRRQALAEAVTDKNNYWFAGAYVNRIWGELMGQAFYQPVDDMGPLKDAVFPDVLTRLAAAYRATDYDVKGLFRTIMNTQTYQRQIRLGESTDEHLQFAASYPKQLPSDALWDSLINALGPLNPRPGFLRPGGPAGGALFGGQFGLEGEFKRLFSYDPSLKADEIEGTIPQALMMMNNPAINQRSKAEGPNLLGRILKEHSRDDDALNSLYMQVLTRRPTARELQRCQSYIARVGNRSEAFEDILWALINSTEFQTKR